jgi:protein-tyrosine phosphatase
VLFGCTANVCRSPMAEAIFDSPASEADLPWKARSAGVAALVGEPIAPRAEALLRELGVPTEGDRARQVDKTILEEADLVPAMSQQHAATLGRVFAGPSAKVHTLLGYARGVPTVEGIPNPLRTIHCRPPRDRSSDLLPSAARRRKVGWGGRQPAFVRAGPGRACKVARPRS